MEGAVPLADDTVSQLWFVAAVQPSVPPPELLMLRLCPAGLAPPCWPVKLKLAALRPITGGIDVTVRLTATVCGVLLAPGADTVTVPL